MDKRRRTIARPGPLLPSIYMESISPMRNMSISASKLILSVLIECCEKIWQIRHEAGWDHRTATKTRSILAGKLELLQILLR